MCVFVSFRIVNLQTAIKTCYPVFYNQKFIIAFWVQTKLFLLLQSFFVFFDETAKKFQQENYENGTRMRKVCDCQWNVARSCETLFL